VGLNHSPSIVTNGLVLCLDAGNTKSYSGSGSIVNDLSTYKTNATIYQATYQSGYFLFDGVDDNIYISSPITNAPQLYNLTNILTQEVIFYPASTGGDDTPALVRCGLGGDLSFGFLFDRINSRVFFHWYDGTFQSSYSSNNIVTLDAWNSITIVRNASNVSFYANGIFINTNTGITNPTVSPGNIGFGAARSGTTVGTTGQDLAGRIASIKIYNKALSGVEVLQNFNALRGRFGI